MKTYTSASFSTFLSLASCLSLLILVLLTACSDITEEERLIYTPPVGVTRAVLIEDFTGQRCLNCPTAHETIEKLQQQYGADKVIAVSIHGGALAVNNTETIIGLRTTLGDNYNKLWNIESWPSGIINRNSGILTNDQWAAKVYEEIQRPVEMQLEVSPEYDDSKNILSVHVTGTPWKEFHGHLQVWLVEDSIVAPQQMPDGKMNREYIHNNVLRESISNWTGDNITDGNGHEIVLKSMEPFTRNYKISVNDAYRHSDHLAIVAFAYDENGVWQVVKEPIRNHVSDSES